jgi:hypothetical protein
MLKEKKAIEDAATGASSDDHPNGVVDLEVMRIASKNLMTSDGLGAVETVPRESSDGADQEGRAEV